MRGGGYPSLLRVARRVFCRLLLFLGCFLVFFAVSGHFWGVGRVLVAVSRGAGRGRGSGGPGRPFFVVLGGFFGDFCRFFRFSRPKERILETATNQNSQKQEKKQAKSTSTGTSTTGTRDRHKHPHHSRVAHPRSRVISVQVAEPNAGELEGDTCAARVWSSFIPPVFWARTCIVAAKGIRGCLGACIFKQKKSIFSPNLAVFRGFCVFFVVFCVFFWCLLALPAGIVDLIF